MEIKKYFSYIFCTSLLLSTAGQLQAVRADEARENMNLFRRSVQSFQRTSERYNRCIRGKCSDEERRKIRKELHTAAKKVLKYGLVLAGIAGTAIVLRKFAPTLKKAAAGIATSMQPSPREQFYGLLDKYEINNLRDPHNSQFVLVLMSQRDTSAEHKKALTSKTVAALMLQGGGGIGNVEDKGKRAGFEALYGRMPDGEEFTAFENQFFPTK